MKKVFLLPLIFLILLQTGLQAQTISNSQSVFGAGQVAAAGPTLRRPASSGFAADYTAGNSKSKNNSSLADTSTVKKSLWAIRISVNPGITFRDPRFVIGADLQLQREISGKFALTFSAGFTHFSGQTVTNTYSVNGQTDYFKFNVDQNIVPFKLGAQFYPFKGAYVGVAGGFAAGLKGGTTGLWSVETGYQLTKKLDVGLKYENYAVFSSGNQLSLKLAYRLF